MTIESIQIVSNYVSRIIADKATKLQQDYGYLLQNWTFYFSQIQVVKIKIQNQSNILDSVGCRLAQGVIFCLGARLCIVCSASCVNMISVSWQHPWPLIGHFVPYKASDWSEYL